MEGEKNKSGEVTSNEKTLNKYDILFKYTHK